MVGELCGSRCRQILDDTTRFLILEKMSIVSFTQFEEGCFSFSSITDHLCKFAGSGFVRRGTY